MADRFLGIDVGAETIKIAEIVRDCGDLSWTRHKIVEHHKEPGALLVRLLEEFDWKSVQAAAVTGRFSRMVALPRIPAKEAQAGGFRFLHDDRPATIVSIGGHGFSVLELRSPGVEIFRENSRCSQGTGNFLRQLVERFGLTIEEASQMCAPVSEPAPLSGRCPVILKTDMTHLANKGESRDRILAGLYDAVCENVQVLIKPRVSPSRVLLIGGVTRSERIRESFRRFLERHEMQLIPHSGDVLFVEALGTAAAAAESRGVLPPIERLLEPPEKRSFESIPSLGTYLGQVRRMDRRPLAPVTGSGVVIGFDIGSTGSKAVAIDSYSRDTVWEGYRNTSGDPVGAAQALMRQFLEGPVGKTPVLALGATGSGREIVGSLMATCYGPESVFVLNEIAAHAAGALHWDPRVDTIFEIGGQDAKYIRLSEGRVVDAAMNEACSAGTGSFIEEQGKRFSGVANVVQLAEKAVASPCGVSLGQHCSVFMAEIIDNAAASGVDQSAIIPGIYDSVIQNYLNRVKGSRSVGQVIFCQGMPFSAPALAAAVARQTGCEIVIPPNPGTVGALGIALLTLTERNGAAIDPARFLDAKVESKDTFICKSTKGCGGAGNKCRIDRLSTLVEGQKKRFTWGGACSLYDKGTGRKKLPDLAPDPFRRREELVAELIRQNSGAPGRPRIALTDEFVLKTLFPFFLTYFHELGLEPVVKTGADHAVLKRGIEESNIPFCAPMQLYHGLISTLAEEQIDYIFLPMFRGIPHVSVEPDAVTCPIEQGSADLLRLDLGPDMARAVVSPTIDMGKADLRSPEFTSMCEKLAADLGFGPRWRAAYDKALGEQEAFDEACQEFGREAVEFCRKEGVTPVVVLGRPYTIYNTVLNSNVPAILREQGAIAIPDDCYPVAADVTTFNTFYWGHGQRSLRAAHQIRREPGVYSLFCSNYSCGPDSFSTHFYSYIMAGKPFTIIETDGHSGDAGTKTRVEAFLYCVKQDLAAGRETPPSSLNDIERQHVPMRAIRERNDILLIPWLSQAADAVASCFRGVGYRAESLGIPDREALRSGRRHTSGKECIPMTLTLGSFLQRVEHAKAGETFTVLMPTANGPCRFGVYHLLQKVIIERLGLKDRVRIWTPSDDDYFDEAGKGFGALTFSAIMASDVLEQALRDTIHADPVRAREIHDRYIAELHRVLEAAGRRPLTVSRAILEAASGRLFGCAALVRRAAAEFAAIRRDPVAPTILIVGEIYVRCDPFSNDEIVRRFEEQGIRVRFAPISEWIEYTAEVNIGRVRGLAIGQRLAYWIQNRIQNSIYTAMARTMGWPARTTARQCLEAATPWIRPELEGEAGITLGEAVAEWREGLIDGTVSVGPHECMPNKVAEAQFFHVAESEGLPSLTLALNGDPVDPEIIERFAYEVHSRFRRRRGAAMRPSQAARTRAAGLPAGRSLRSPGDPTAG